MCNSMLAGLVAITSPCAFVTPVGAFIIGLVSGVLVVVSVFFFDRIKIDDPVGAISVHGVNGGVGFDRRRPVLGRPATAPAGTPSVPPTTWASPARASPGCSTGIPSS